MADDVANLLLRITSDVDEPQDDLQDLGEKLKQFGSTEAEAEVGVRGKDKVERDILRVFELLQDLSGEHADPEVNLKAEGLKAEAVIVTQRLADLSRQEATPQVKVDIGLAVTQLEVIERKLKALDGETVNVDVKVDKKGDGRASIAALTAGFAALLSQGVKISALGFAAQGVGALGATLAGLVGVLGPAAGGLAAFAGVALAAKQGLGVLKLGMLGVKDSFKEFGEALKEPTPALNNFKKNMSEFIPDVVHLKNLAQGPILRGLTEGIRSASSNFGVLNPIVRETANQIGGVARKFGDFVGSPAFGRDLLRIGRTNTVVIGHLGDAALSLAKAFTHVLVAAGPLIRWIAKGISTFAESLAATTALGRATGALGGFFDKTKTVLGVFASILSNLGGIFTGVGKAAYDFGLFVIKGIDGALGSLNELTNSAKGQSALKDYFEQLKPAVTEFGKLLVDVAEGFVALAVQPGLVKLIRMIRTDLLPALITIVDTTTQSLGPALIKTGASFVQFIQPFIGASGPLITFVEMMGNIFEVLSKTIGVLPGATTALVAFVGAAAVFKAVKLVGSVTGITQMATHLKGLVVAQEAATASAVRNRAALIAQKTAALASAAASAVARGAVVAWTAVQWLLNAALLANPIGLVVVAIVALIAIFVLAWKHSETFRDIVTGAFNFVLGVVTSVWDWIKNNWPKLLVILTGPIGLAVAAIIKYWDQIKAATLAVWNAIKGVVTGVVGAISSVVTSVFGTLASTVSSIWNGVKDAASSAWGSVKSAITGAVSGALGAIRDLFDRFVSVGGDLVDKIASGIKSAVSSVKDAVTSVVSRGVDGIRGLASDFYNAGKNLVSSIADGVVSGATALYDKVKGIVGKIKDLLPGSEPKDPRSPLRGLKRSGSAIMENIADGVPAGVARLTRTIAAELSVMPLLSAMPTPSITPFMMSPGTLAAVGASALHPSFTVKAFIGDRELKDVVRVEIEEDGQRTQATYDAGVSLV